jgi:hypothetical protein
MGVRRCETIGPVSIFMTVTPVSVSPLAMAHCIGATPSPSATVAAQSRAGHFGLPVSGF